MINEIINQAREDKLDNPEIISEWIVKLSASLWQAGLEMFDKEIEYAKRWSEIRSSLDSDKQCDMRMRLEKEWLEMERAKQTQKTMEKTVSALKVRLRVLGDEWRHS